MQDFSKLPQTSADLQIRDAVEGDLDAITAIYGHHVAQGLGSFEETPPERAEMGRRFADLKAKNYPYVVAERDGRIMGYAYAGAYRPRPAYRYTVEDSVYVAADAVGGGVGRALLVALIERATALGFRQMVAVIGDSGNAGSIGVHKAMGFKEAGLLPSIGFKHGRWVDIVLMQRALGDGDTSPPV